MPHLLKLRDYERKRLEQFEGNTVELVQLVAVCLQERGYLSDLGEPTQYYWRNSKLLFESMVNYRREYLLSILEKRKVKGVKGGLI